MGAVFLSGSTPPRVGTNLKLFFKVPGGIVGAGGVVRNIMPSEGMGVEFTELGDASRLLLERLLERLLR